MVVLVHGVLGLGWWENAPVTGADELDRESPFVERDISGWAVMSKETRGIDPKDWVAHPNRISEDGQAHWWLFKPIKQASYRRCDDWAEKLAAELASELGLPAARVELARRHNQQGIVSRNVTPNGWSLESGDTVLYECSGYVSCAVEPRPKNRKGHNLANITKVLGGCCGPPGTGCSDWTAAEVFAGFLVFDAWIANTDRHAINWGVLTCEGDGRRALAASFDHGAALASGVRDQDLANTPVERFAKRGYATRFENGKHLPLVELAREAVERTGGNARLWLNRMDAVSDQAVEAIVSRIPEMSEARRRFTIDLLCINRRRLAS